MKMKTTTLTAIALATIAFSSAPAFAEDSPEPAQHENKMGGPRDHHGGMEKRSKERFERTDTNHDGFLSKDEMEKEHQARFNEMFEKTDADKDGKLSPEELKKGREAMREKMKDRMKERRANKETSKSSE